MYQALRILGLAIPIVLIAFFAYDLLDDDGEASYVIYRSGDEGEYRDTDIVAECMFSNPGHEFIGWNTEEDGSGEWHMPGEDLGLRNEAIILYAQWGPEGTDPSTGDQSFRSLRSIAALTSPRWSGDGLPGLDLNSGWNCDATK